jgi:hypothetical protein
VLRYTKSLKSAKAEKFADMEAAYEAEHKAQYARAKPGMRAKFDAKATLS